MASRDSVAGDERLRLFLGLRLPEPVLDAVEAWQREQLSAVRIVPRGNLHVTLAFLGSRPAAELDAVVGELRAACANAPEDLRLAPSRYRETRNVAMLVLEDVGGGVTALAGDVQARLETLGVYRREGRPWLPHLTVARFRQPPGLRLDPPAMGTCVPSDAAAFLSRLHPDGARYEPLELIALNRTGG
ncbi:MAG: 2,3-cyclic 3-phosphodiesterase [Gaiellaceae bacterium]|jgi:2'-5' RNA ligase|nr:2,3-cyclic 3-phosphodiesterase [Gaiellaceae bacterium]